MFYFLFCIYLDRRTCLWEYSSKANQVPPKSGIFSLLIQQTMLRAEKSFVPEISRRTSSQRRAVVAKVRHRIGAWGHEAIRFPEIRLMGKWKPWRRCRGHSHVPRLVGAEAAATVQWLRARQTVDRRLDRVVGRVGFRSGGPLGLVHAVPGSVAMMEGH